MARKQRAGLSAKVRFEVFKRDSFKCQYCGASAPEVVLRVDHIKPVAKGGENDLMNLVTACFGCNAGKSDRELSDASVVEKQRRQLEELNERRVQLEMMLEWRQHLDGMKAMTAGALVGRIERSAPGWTLTETGIAKVNKWLRDYSLSELLDAVEASEQQYLRRDADGGVVPESWNTFFDKIPRIAAIERAAIDEPYLKDLFYVQAVLRNNTNWTWRAKRDCMPLLKAAVAAGIEPHELKTLAKDVSSWGRFEEIINSWIADAQRQPPPEEGDA